MSQCPCCSNQLLRHVRHHDVYWFCSHCRQEMPDLSSGSSSGLSSGLSSGGLSYHRVQLEQLRERLLLTTR